MVISVSRRCDIPRFRFNWFLERLDAGFVETANPFNARQRRRVSLKPEDARAFVFWTRDPAAILAAAGRLAGDGRFFYVMTTLTGYPAVLEPHTPPPEAAAASMAALARQTGADRVIWRYDPVFLSDITGADFHLRNFSRLAGLLAGSVTRVIVSVYDEYPRPARRLAALEQAGRLRPLPHYDGDGRLLPEARELLRGLAGIARSAGMAMQSCAEGEDLSPLGIPPGACVDGGLLAASGVEAGGKDRNQRPRCLCAASMDIGGYGSCPAGCVYCYARR